MKCIICNKEMKGHGHNAMPFFKGRCCDSCNTYIRLERLNKETIKSNQCEGKCSKCGSCCIDFIPLTNKEIETIKEYMKTNPVVRTRCTDEQGNLIITCPFLNNNGCQIYAVRPEICKGFNCGDSKDVIAKNKIKCHSVAVINNGLHLESLHSIFFGDKKYSDYLVGETMKGNIQRADD